MFPLPFNLQNDAFRPRPKAEITRILRQLANQIERDITRGPIKDENGNTIGSFHYA